MPLDHTVHHYAKDPEGDMWRVAKITPLVCITHHGHSVYLQGGRVLDGGGEVIDKPPAWFYVEVAKMTPRALAECGFKEAPKNPVEVKLDDDHATVGLKGGGTENQQLNRVMQQAMPARKG